MAEYHAYALEARDAVWVTRTTLEMEQMLRVTISVGQGFGDPWRVTGKGVRGWGWGLQSWNPRTLRLPASTPVAAILCCLVIDLQV